MAENSNATCTICGKPYRMCQSCSEVKSFKPWRTVTDTIEHYIIYMAIHSYTTTKDRERAKRDLEKCNLSELETFSPEIIDVIKEIMADEKPKSIKRKVKNIENKTEETTVSSDDNE